MRFYGGKIVQQALNRRFRQHVESRDAIVWDVDTVSKLVRCKIQGSDEYVLCHYPRNSTTLPNYCRRGNAVRIAHKGGIRGFLEVVGHGRAIPTPIAGSQFPTPNDRPDEIVTGGVVTTVTGMTLMVGATTYRTSGVVYTLVIEGVPMLASPIMTMGDGNTMGSDGIYLAFDAAPAIPNARYDLIVAGTDGLAHIVKGTAGATPAIPDTPADHTKIAHVLILGGITEILPEHINGDFETRLLNSIVFELVNGTGTIDGNGDFEWHETDDNPYCGVVVTMRCQYGWALSGTYTIDFSMITGSGDWSLTTSGWATSDLEKTFTGSSATIYYRRDQTVAETSPMVLADAQGTIISNINKIQLLDALGGDI